MIRPAVYFFLVSVLSCVCAEEPPTPKPVSATRIFRFNGGESVSIQIAGEPAARAVDPSNTNAVNLVQIVSSDGFIASTQIGYVNILGLTLQEASDVIAGKFRSATGLKNPVVAISLVSVPPRKAYVQGEVVQPKVVELPYDHEFTLASILAEAGGATEDADLSRIKVLKREPGGSVRMEVVDGAGFAKAGQSFMGPTLNSGDIVIVPRSEVITVSGEVKKPGIVTRKNSRVPLGVPIRLSHVVATVGGLNPNADRNAITLIRVDAQGNRKGTSYTMESLEHGDPASDPALQDGDQVVIPASEGIMVLGAISAPGIYYMPAGPSTLSRLLALAGGLQSFAKKNTVMVVKKNTPGKQMTVDMRAVIEQGRSDLDVTLSAGDLVYVGGSSAP